MFFFVNIDGSCVEIRHSHYSVKKNWFIDKQNNNSHSKMQMQLYKILILILIPPVIHGIEARRSSRTSEWIDALVQCVTRDFVEYQVTIIVQDKDSEWTTVIGALIQRFSQHFPTKSFTYDEIITSLKNHVGSASRSSTMDSDAATLYVPIFVLTEKYHLFNVMTPGLVEGKPRPKYLIVFLNGEEDASYTSILEQLWNPSRYLDITVIQLLQRSGNIKSHFPDQLERDAIVRIYNPFNQSHTRYKLTSESVLFPDKARNLNNSELKLSTLPADPRGNLRQIELGETLAQSMKFRPVYIPVTNDGESVFEIWYLGSEFCLREHALRLVELESLRQIYSYSKVTKIVTLHAVIPVLPNQNFRIVISWEFVLTILGTILGIFFFKILTKVLKFEDRFWRLMCIIQMILGVSIPDEPRCLTERIVFGTIMLTWIIYSGHLHSVLTTISLHKESDQIEDLDDLIKSDLVTMMTGYQKMIAEFGLDTYLQKISNKSILHGETRYEDECIDHLAKHKNVTCLCSSTNLYNFVRKINVRYPDLKMRVIRQPLMYSWAAFLLNFVSPFRNRINQVLSRLSESGLMDKMEGIEAHHIDFEQYDPEESQHLLEWQKILFCVVLIGYSLSIIAFIAEVVIGWLKKKTEPLTDRRCWLRTDAGVTPAVGIVLAKYRQRVLAKN